MNSSALLASIKSPTPFKDNDDDDDENDGDDEKGKEVIPLRLKGFLLGNKGGCSRFIIENAAADAKEGLQVRKRRRRSCIVLYIRLVIHRETGRIKEK